MVARRSGPGWKILPLVLACVACGDDNPGTPTSSASSAGSEGTGAAGAGGGAGAGGATDFDTELYGIHETTIEHAQSYANPFRDVTLDATFTAPSGRTIAFWGFYDGDGKGGPTGDVWRIRFMPDEEGAWTLEWSFSDASAEGSAAFTVGDTNIPGPARLDPDNPQVMVDARGNPIHFRGYGIKHRGSYNDPPLSLGKAEPFIAEVIEPHLVAGGYNAAYLQVPTGWPTGHVDSLWGDYAMYDLQAGHYVDTVLRHLHQKRVWALGWITFCIQVTWSDLQNGYQPLMRYFVARYGAFYNYFMWSPCWEMWELENWEAKTDEMMSYLVSIDPWQRLQGAHDRALDEWQDWQSIHPRQQPCRTVFDGNTRDVGVDAEIAPYGRVVFGSEDLWEYCDGSWGKPRDGTEVRRGLWGELMANVLPLYDEHCEGAPPCAGLGNGDGEPFVQLALDWWYANVDYRNPGFTMHNELVSAEELQVASSVPGQQYVVYDEDGGPIAIDLSQAPGATFDVLWFDPVAGTEQAGDAVQGGTTQVLASPIAGDTVLLLNTAR